MQLTSNQLSDLRHDITLLGRITYDHLADELLDHYATLTEEKMAAGQSFYEASTAAFIAMGNGAGIQQIQDDYEKATKKQVRARHVAIMKSYFRRPTVITTLLVGTLLGSIYVNVPTNWAQGLLWIMVWSPALIILAAAIPYYRNRDSRHKLVWKYITDNGNWLFNLINVWLLVHDKESLMVPFTTHLNIVFLLAFASFFQAFTLAQLTRETFYYKPTFQR